MLFMFYLKILELFTPGVVLGGVTVDEHDARRRPRGRVRGLDVVGPLHAAPVRGLDQQLQPRQPDGLADGQPPLHATNCQDQGFQGVNTEGESL